MTKNVVALDWGTITQSKTYYKVYLEEEEWQVYVPVEEVNKVERMTGQDEYLIAVLLAYVKYSRKNTLAAKNKVPKVDEEVVLNSVTALIKGYEHSMQTLINEVKELKWCELREVLLSKEPAATLYQAT